MVCGSATLGAIASKRGWTPGSFANADHDQRVWGEHYRGHCVNDDALICRFADVEPRWDPMFLRPCQDTKSFAGEVTTWAKFSTWRNSVLALKDDEDLFVTINADTSVAYASLKHIRSEHRFWVVDGRVVTDSTYKVGQRVIYLRETDGEARSFAQRMANLYAPARAFVLDVAMTEGGPKVIEVNCVNDSGFYAADMNAFVDAIEGMDFPNDAMRAMCDPTP